jgi:hypothetical protein
MLLLFEQLTLCAAPKLQRYASRHLQPHCLNPILQYPATQPRISSRYAPTVHLNAFNVTGLFLSLVNTSPPFASVAKVLAMIVATVS